MKTKELSFYYRISGLNHLSDGLSPVYVKQTISRSSEEELDIESASFKKAYKGVSKTLKAAIAKEMCIPKFLIKPISEKYYYSHVDD